MKNSTSGRMQYHRHVNGRDTLRIAVSLCDPVSEQQTTSFTDSVVCLQQVKPFLNISVLRVFGFNRI